MRGSVAQDSRALSEKSSGFLKLFSLRSAGFFRIVPNVPASTKRGSSPQVKSTISWSIHLDHESFDLVLQASNLIHKIASFIGGNARGDDSSANTTCTSQCCLRWNIHIGDILILSKKRKVEEDCEWRRIGRENNELSYSSIQCLGRFVRTLLQLASMSRLLYKI